MKISFACPSCGVTGSVDESFAGKGVRCRQCKHRFAIPMPGEPEVAGYGLDEPEPAAVARASESTAVFVPARGDEPTVLTPPRRPRRTASRPAPGRRAGPGVDWTKWLIRGAAIAAVLIVATALLAPDGGAIAGVILALVGSVLVLAGYAAGAYGAFREDFLYGFLYLVFPLYSGYYFVTRWDDLWRWAAASTAGFVLVTVGTRLIVGSWVVE